MKLNAPALLLAFFVFATYPAPAQEESSAHYTLNVFADEVILTFHATDARGLPVNDLTINDLHLLDNNLPPRKILSFTVQRDIPLRVGILIDTSTSMRRTLPRNRAIHTEHAPPRYRSGFPHLIRSSLASPRILDVKPHNDH